MSNENGTITVRMEEQYAKVLKERDELLAHCERLAKSIVDYRSATNDERDTGAMMIAVMDTPAQSLSHLRAEAVEEAVRKVEGFCSATNDPDSGWSCCPSFDLLEQAQQLRTDSQEG